jgi:3-hydroxyisobutyrate dehydrogenase
MIKAVANGSGGSTQFGIRAPWMAQRKFKPIQGSPKLLSHYFGMIDNWADSIGVATPIFDRAVELYEHCDKMGLADDNDVSVMIDVLNDIPREKH